MLLTERYQKQIAGVLSCFDRVIVQGTLQFLGYAKGMELYLRSRQIRLFDYAPVFAEPLRDAIRANAERIAQENSREIEFIRSRKAFRKETRIQEILKQRGDAPGLVHIFSAMEACPSFEPWHNKRTGQTSLRYKESKCLHYYFYFLDPELGLCYLRVPTWAPFRLQFYCNAHNWLANQLRKPGLAFTLLDNAFVRIADWKLAQQLADQFSAEVLLPVLEQAAALYCPVAASLDQTYYWSLMQLEYATDIVFQRQTDLAPLYETLVRTAIHSVKPDHVATFLGRRLTDLYEDELGNDFHTRLEGTRLKHHMGPAAVKLYDKQQIVLRLETMTNNVSFFKHHRQVQHRDGTRETQFAPVKKTIHSLGALQELMGDSNRRYLLFLSQLSDPSAGIPKVDKLSRTVRHNDRTYRGFNLFDSEEVQLFRVLSRGEFTITGFRNSMLRPFLSDKTGTQISRILKRLRLHGLIKKAARTYKYYLTTFGREVILTALKLRELVVIPALAGAQTAP